VVDVDRENYDRYFEFKPGNSTVVSTKDGKIFVTDMFAADMEAAPGLFLRSVDRPSRLVFIPWGNVASMESEVLIDDE